MRSIRPALRLSVAAFGTAALTLPFAPLPASAGIISISATEVGVTQHLPIPVDTDGVSVTVEGPGIPAGTALVLAGGRERALHLNMDISTATSLVMTEGAAGTACRKVNQVLAVTLSGATAQARAWYTSRAYDTATGEVGPEQTTELLAQSQSTGNSASTYTIKVCG